MIPIDIPLELRRQRPPSPEETINSIDLMLKTTFGNLQRSIQIDGAQTLINEFADYSSLDRNAVTRLIREGQFQILVSAVRDKITSGQISIDLGAIAAIFSAASALRTRNQ